MQSYRELNLVCGANAYTFSQLLRRSSSTKYIFKDREVYRPFCDSYRPFTTALEHCLQCMPSKSGSLKARCPACFHNLGKVHTITLDACFGAVGKLHQNQNPTQPFNGNEYMLPDLTKEYVFQHTSAEEIAAPDIKEGCQRRSTRGVLQKAGYYDGLNETGLCGSVCKHDVPVYFLNVRFGGEKMIFPSTILDKVIEEKRDFKLLAKYDSMCVFDVWRRVTISFVLWCLSLIFSSEQRAVYAVHLCCICWSLIDT